LAPTVDTRFGQPRFFLHPEHHRGFSVREAARIQGFPDDFEFEGSVQSQFRMVGNAVPPPLAASVARSIRDSEF
jgi:DNA (cytosine-5)-methyltransferase 1